MDERRVDRSRRALVTRRRAVASAAWSVPVLIVVTPAPAGAASPLGATDITFNFYALFGTAYDGTGRPTALGGGLSIFNTNLPVSQTITALTVTLTFPDTRVSGSAPSAVAGDGWAFLSAVHGGAQWVYTFTWTGSLPSYGSTSSLDVTIVLTDNSAGSFGSTATASGPEVSTASTSATVGL